jgi:hypothetical protein
MYEPNSFRLSSNVILHMNIKKILEIGKRELIYALSPQNSTTVVSYTDKPAQF